MVDYFHRTNNSQNNFVGAITVEKTCDKDGTNKQIVIKEIKLSPEIGDELMDLHYGYSEYYLANPESLPIKIVKTKKLMKEEIIPTNDFEIK